MYENRCWRWCSLAVVAFGVAGAWGSCGDTNEVPPNLLEVGVPVEVGDAPFGLAAVPGGVAVASCRGPSVVLVGPGGEVTTLSDERPRECTLPVFAFGSLWAGGPIQWVEFGPDEQGGYGGYTLGTIVRLDPLTGEQQALIEVDGIWMVATDDALWALNQDGALHRIDPATNAVTVFPGVVGESAEGESGGMVVPTALAWDGTRFWVAAYDESQFSGALIGVDDPANPAAAIRLDLGPIIPGRMAFGDGVLWVTGTQLDPFQGMLVRMDTEGNRTVIPVPFGWPASGVTIGADGLWVTDCMAGTLTLLDPESGGAVAGPVSVGTPFPEGEGVLDAPYREDYSCPGGVLQVGDTVWVTNWNDDAVVPVKINWQQETGVRSNH